MIWLPKIAAIEVGNTAVRVALVRTGLTRPRVLSLVERQIVPRENESKSTATARALEDALEELNGTADVFVSHLSGRNALVRVISVPFAKRRQIETTIQFELEPHVPLPIDDLVVDFSPISVSGGKTEVLAVAVKKKSVRDHLDTLTEAGIDAEIVGLDFASLTSLWLRENTVREGEVTVLLHATSNRSQLVILDGRRMIYLRVLSLSAQQLAEDEQGTAEEIVTTLRAFAATSRRSEIHRLVVTGVELSAEQSTALEKKLGLSVSACELAADLVPQAQLEGGDASSWAALIGSAFSYGNGAGAAFNLRKGEFQSRGAIAGVKKHIAFSGALVVLLLLAGLGHLRSQIRMRQAENDALESQMVELFKKAFPDETVVPGKVVTLMEAAASDRQKEYGVYQPYLAGAAPTLDVLREVISLMPDSRGLMVRELSIRKGVVTVRGEVADTSEAQSIKQRLEKSELLRDVSVVPQTSRDKNKIDFTISARRS